MRIDAPMPPRREENITPMINVVFLLLIFFLLTARIAPPPPFEADPPESAATKAAGAAAELHVSAGAEMIHGVARGDDAYDAVIAAAAGGPVRVRADRGVEAAKLAAILAELSRRGAASVELTVRPR